MRAGRRRPGAGGSGSHRSHGHPGPRLLCTHRGEEFAVLLPATGLAGAESIAERLRTALARRAVQPAADTDQEMAFTVSIGVAELHERMSFAEGLQRADAALYRAKQAGRNRVMTQMDEDEPALRSG